MLSIANYVGAYCAWPRQGYDPAELPEEYHAAALTYFERAAFRWLWDHCQRPDGVSPTVFREGLRERAGEYAANAYLTWRRRRMERIPRGAHVTALAAVRRWMERTGWQGVKSMRRQANRKATAESLAYRERLRERNVPTPDAVAMLGERLAIACHRKKARVIADRLGLTIDGLARLSNGLTIEAGPARPAYVGGAPLPTTGVPGVHRDNLATGSGYYRGSRPRHCVMSERWFAEQCQANGLGEPTFTLILRRMPE